MVSKWRKYHGALVPNLAPHEDLDLTEIVHELRLHNAFFARWVTDFDTSKKTDFWYIIQDQVMNLKDYSTNTRNQISKGLKKFKIKKINRAEMSSNAYIIYKKSSLIYNTKNKILSEKVFIDLLTQSFDYWGVYRDDKLIGFSKNRMYKDCCDYSTIKILPEYVKEYPFYALFYTMNLYYLNEKKLKYVTDGSRNISHKTNIQQFLLTKFKFRKAYCNLHIKYSWSFGLVVKLLFPFRKIFSYFDNLLFRNIFSVLFQEEISRNCKQK